jgi:methionyl-tRNA formyltransferase
MRIIFMGTPEFAAVPLDLLMQNRADVAAIYTQPDKESGRGRNIVASPVKRIALKWGLRIYQPVNFKLAEEKDRLISLKPDVIVVAAYGQILPRAVLEMPRFGCLNIHPSLLPLYRGVSPVTAAILNGDVFTGVSIIKLDTGVDTGPVVVRAQVAITDWDTTILLTEKLARIGGQLLLEILPRWVNGKITAQAQDDARATYTRMVEKRAGEIDWQLPAVQLWRQARAYHPWPGSYTIWQGKQLKIIEAVSVEGQSNTPGRVVQLAGINAFGVETGLGILGIIRIQMEGKRVMTAGEFLRGQRDLIGAVLPGKQEGTEIGNPQEPE